MKELPPRLAALHRALSAEQAAEAGELALLAAGSLGDRIASGVSWPKLRVDVCERAGRGFAVDLRAPKGVVLHDGLSAGDPVHLVVAGRPIWGILLGHDGRVAELRSEDPVDLGAPVEVRRRADPSTWVRYRQALERGAEAPGRLVKLLLAEPLLIDRATGEGATLSGLDAAQQAAADRALRAEHLAAIHGPPGTGKTRVIGRIAAELVARGDRPWVLADSNAAVDHLALTCHREGLQVVRLGRVSRMSEEAKALSLDAQLQTSPLASALAVLDRELARADDSRERRRLAGERQKLRRQAEHHIMESADVLATTFGTLVRRAEHLPAPHTALVDEATQASEPAVWAAIPYVQRLIIVGDPEQLGPVCRVPGALEMSLLERLLLEDRVQAPMLEVQHRMDPRIRRLVRGVYGSAYRDHASVSPQPLSARAGVASTELTERAVMWIDTAGAGMEEFTDEVTRSLYNPGEVRVLQRVVEQLQQAGVPPADLGVIAPYSAQVARLQAALPGLEVATVNAFQGRERPVMVASMVRSNPDGTLGFVADGRRLTVTLTRARCLLVMVGNSATLGGHQRFANLLEQLEADGQLMSVFEPPYDDTL